MENINKTTLPDFIVVGAMKSGTTSLHDILRQHSKVFLPPEKELHFFDNDLSFNKGLEYYASFFKNKKEGMIAGEITPRYIFEPEVPKRIMRTLGSGIKLIFILRNPANRFYSQVKMMINLGKENRSLNDILKFELDRYNKGITYDFTQNFILRGFYAQQIKRYLSLFPRKQLHFIIFEDDFINQTEKTINDLLSFLNIPQEKLYLNVKSFTSENTILNNFDRVINSSNLILRSVKSLIPSVKYRVLIKEKLNSLNLKRGNYPDKEFKLLKPKLIRDVYYDDIKELEKLINRDLSGWYKEYI